MNDRFKFRGITKGKVNEFVYGSLLWYAGEPQIWDKDGKNYIVKPETIQQCTGLKDNNGKLIYEGDIVRFYSPYGHATFEIKWSEEFATFGYEDNETDFSEFGRLYDDARYVEVIGNIYEKKNY